MSLKLPSFKNTPIRTSSFLRSDLNSEAQRQDTMKAVPCPKRRNRMSKATAGVKSSGKFDVNALGGLP